MSFLQGSLDLFTGKRSGHMGSYQYVDHAGMRDGVSMSGAKLWAEVEAILDDGSENLAGSHRTAIPVPSRQGKSDEAVHPPARHERPLQGPDLGSP